MSQQYSSPKIWGPHFWFILRCIAHNYPLNPTPEDAQHVKTFFTELQYILPCEVCKYTFKQHFTKNPIEKGLVNKAKLIEWVELIYQETKKVIQDKRVKILDAYDEEEEIRPIKVVYKPRIDPLEEKLNQMRQSVINTEKRVQPLQIPLEPPKQNNNKAKAINQPAPMITQQPIQKTLMTPIIQIKPENKVHNMNQPHPDEFGKIQHNNKLGFNNKQIQHKNSYNLNDHTDFTSQLEKLTAGKKVETDIHMSQPSQHVAKSNSVLIQHKTIVPPPKPPQAVSSLYLPPKIENKPENKVKSFPIPKQPILELKFENSNFNNKDVFGVFGAHKINVPSSKHDIVTKQTHMPNQRAIVPRNASNELVITKRCKKCDH